MQITEQLVKDHLLLFNSALIQPDKKNRDSCLEKESVTVTREVCEFVCKILKNATPEVASDFFYRWIQKSHQDMSATQLQHCREIRTLEEERDKQLQLAMSSKEQEHLGLSLMSEERKKAAAEIKAVKLSCSSDVQCMQALFLVTFEKFCATQQYLQTQQNLMAKEILERELQRGLTKQSKHALQEIAVKTTTELRFYRSSLIGMAKALYNYNEESKKELKAIEVSMIRLMERRQREHDIRLQNADFQFAKLSSEMVSEVGILNNSIQEKEACIITLSENLSLEQSELSKAHKKNHEDELQLAEMMKKHGFDEQRLQDLSAGAEILQKEKMNMEQSLHKELEATARHKREARVMEENYRRVENDKEKLLRLNEEHTETIKRIQDQLDKESEAHTNLKMGNEQLKAETETIRLSRDKMRYAMKNFFFRKCCSIHLIL
jgi:hypothetical protein